MNSIMGFSALPEKAQSFLANWVNSNCDRIHPTSIILVESGSNCLQLLTCDREFSLNVVHLVVED